VKQQRRALQIGHQDAIAQRSSPGRRGTCIKVQTVASVTIRLPISTPAQRVIRISAETVAHTLQCRSWFPVTRLKTKKRRTGFRQSRCAQRSLPGHSLPTVLLPPA
jgi:hypothetical protein